MSDRILYISGRCPHCKKILLGFQQYSFLKSLFNVVNIDKQAYPNIIQTVPSIVIHNQVVAGDKVFEYFGKLVEEKNLQEERSSKGADKESDKGECRINEDGELEGWCSNNSGVEYSTITEENDDFTKKNYKIETNYDLLSNSDNSLDDQVKHMEEGDNKINSQKKGFDSDYARLQQERGNLLQDKNGPPIMGRPQ